VSTGILDNGSSNISIEENSIIEFTVAGSQSVLVVDVGRTTVDGELLASILKTSPVLLSELPNPAAVGAGARAFVSDANDTAFGSVANGGGANNIPVFSNGTNWLIG
jgi:hypothetical protein